MKILKHILTVIGSSLLVAGIVFAATTTLQISQGGTGSSNTAFKIGIATTTPFAVLSISATSTLTNLPLFNIGTASTSVFTVDGKGGIELWEDRPATSTAITFNWASSSPTTLYQIGTAAVTITFINATTSTMAGSRKLVTICNPGGTAGALTWVGVEWAGGSTPSQTTTASVCDAWSFYVTNATSTTAWKVFGAQTANFQ